jgi:hypothetical protein
MLEDLLAMMQREVRIPVTGLDTPEVVVWAAHDLFSNPRRKMFDSFVLPELNAKVVASVLEIPQKVPVGALLYKVIAQKIPWVSRTIEVWSDKVRYVWPITFKRE